MFKFLSNFPFYLKFWVFFFFFLVPSQEFVTVQKSVPKAICWIRRIALMHLAIAYLHTPSPTLAIHSKDDINKLGKSILYPLKFTTIFNSITKVLIFSIDPFKVSISFNSSIFFQNALNSYLFFPKFPQQ